MVTLNDYVQSIKVQASRLEMYVAWKQKKSVKRLSPVLGHSHNTAWIQKLDEFGWD